MGHTDVRTAMRYQHPVLDSVREAIDQRNLRHTFITIARFPVASYAAVPKVWRAQYSTRDSGSAALVRASRNCFVTVVRCPHSALREGNSQPSGLFEQRIKAITRNWKE
jgi:hypothetical protein